jgi:hypothetical protein
MEFILVLVGVLLIVAGLTPPTVLKRELALWRWRRRARRPRRSASPRLTLRP